MSCTNNGTGNSPGERRKRDPVTKTRDATRPGGEPGAEPNRGAENQPLGRAGYVAGGLAEQQVERV